MNYLNAHILIRKIQTSQREVFLTFDDGPDSELTPKILDILASHNALASFFVIGNKARNQKALIQKIINQGHQVISHSKDHKYYHYFLGKNHLKNWVTESVEDLEDIIGKKSLGFRPPAGIVVPPFVTACTELGIPVYLWNHRFFDTTKVFTQKKAQASALKIQAGDIVLLHDHKNSIHTLDFYLKNLKNNNFKMSAIS